MREKINGKTDDSVERLVGSLELITARLIDITVANNQLATSQTPEMRALFDRWLGCLTEEILRAVDERGGDIDVPELAKALGLSASSTLSLLLSLERRGEIDISNIRARRGDGKNREICDCLLP